MGYTLVSTSASDVTVRVDANKDTKGELSGTAYLQVLDDSKSPPSVVASYTVSPSGEVDEGGPTVSASDSEGFTLDVTWDGMGTVTGSAAGDYNGASLTCMVPVSVDG